MSIKRITYFVLLLTAFAVSACRKTDPKPQTPPTPPTPVFYFTGEINGIPVNLNAGINGYVVDANYFIDGDGVHEFTSALKGNNCTSSCPNSLKVSIRDYCVNSGNISNTDSSFTNGYYSFATPSGAQSKYKQTFVGVLLNKKGKNFNWDFGDGTPSVQTNVDTITHTFSAPGIYNVSLSAQDSTGTGSSSITNNVKIGQIGNIPTAQFYSTSNIASNLVSFISVPIAGTAPYSYDWDFGDGSTSTSSTPSHQYSSSGVYLTTLKITDAAGLTDIQHLNVPFQATNLCSASFYSASIAALPNPLNLKSIIIEWIDPNGTLWTSNDNRQNTEKSAFKIVSIEEYKKNEKGQATKKVTVEVTCMLYNGNNSISVKNAKTVLAVAY